MAKTAGLTHAESVRLSLENDIFTGRLPPGASLDEEALARRFSVSRTPVREAMLQLIQSGLVEKKPRQGAIVTQIDLSDMIRLFEVMSELEGIPPHDPAGTSGAAQAARAVGRGLRGREP